MRQYLDFDLAIEPTGEAEYVARVLRSPAGEAETTFEWPFSPQDLEILILRIGHTRRGTRRSDSPEMRQARDFGRTLFETVFSGPARTCLIRSIDEAERQDAGLRIRLRLSSSPQLNDVPWEYLYSDDLNRFLIVSTETPIVRYIDLQRRVRPVTVALPLHILAVVSAPSDLPQLDVEGEWERLQQALAPLDRQVALERLEAPTLEKLQQRLRREEVHILHFIGHGAFNPGSDEGVLFFTNERGGSHAVTGEDLGTVLHDHRALRLVVLNSCEGARSDPADPFSGSATALVGQGIPAVIAMQFEITDRAALTIAKNFYGSLADGYAVDAALAEARKAIFSQGNDVEWGTPVLYMRSQNGRLFDIDTTVAPPTDESATARAALLSEAKAAVNNAEWGPAMSTLEQLVEERPDDDEALGLLEEARLHHLAANLYRGAGFLAAAEQWDAVLERFRDIDALDVAIEDPEDLRAQAVNAVEARRRAERLAEQLETARAGLADADWALAQRNAEAVLAEHPDNDEAQRIATEAMNRAAVAELYVLAARAADAEQWDQVLKRFEEIEAIGAAYLDDQDDLRQRAAAQIAERARQRDLDSRYQGALALMEAEDWDQALSIIDSVAADEPGYRGIEQLRERVAAELDAARRAADQAAAERHYVDAIRAAAIEDWQAVTAALDRIDEIAPGFGDPENLRRRARANTAEISDRTETATAGQTESNAVDAAGMHDRAGLGAPVLDESSTPPPVVSGRGEEVDAERSAPRRPLPEPPTSVWWRRIPAWLPGALIILSADLPWNLEWWGDRPGHLPIGVLVGRADISLGGLPIRLVLLALGTIIVLQPYRYQERALIRRVAAVLTVVSVFAIALSTALSSEISFGPLATSIGPWLALGAAATMVNERLPSFMSTPISGGPLAASTGSVAVAALGSIAVFIAAWLPWYRFAEDDSATGFEWSLTERLSLGTALLLTGIVSLVAVLASSARKRPPPTWLGVVGFAVFVYAASFPMFWLSDSFVHRDPIIVSAAAWVAAFAGLLLAVGNRLPPRAGLATGILFLLGFLLWSQTGSFAQELWWNADSDQEVLVVGLAGLGAAVLVAAAVVFADRQLRQVPRNRSWKRNAVTIAVVGLAGFALFAYGGSRGSTGGYWASIAASILTLLVTSGLALSWTREAEPIPDRPT